ncbi:hypothetical protein GCM10025881_22820 [Pseudolysinimonas kribbensis]|uniref:NADP-dependent oxidoreductase domain-containing protein n=1 Tax=Pseudolysinimonas kribbensis TaxID=433641 RepID=A0ABQ6K4A4_9MICO|nr:hypothetical protein GCM10025881_22820 [Pseudolysinimonas kribbensis]
MRGSEIVEAQWMAERRGFERFRTEQPNYSILDREIEREILPVAERYGMGTLVYSPLAGGTLTGRYRSGQENDNFRSTRTGMRHFRDERRLAAVEQLVALAEELGVKLTHLAMTFAIAHPGVTSAIAGPRTMEQLEDTLAGVDLALSDEVLDRIDAIVPPGESIGAMDMVYRGPQVGAAALRRRPPRSVPPADLRRHGVVRRVRRKPRPRLRTPRMPSPRRHRRRPARTPRPPPVRWRRC